MLRRIARVIDADRFICSSFLGPYAWVHYGQAESTSCQRRIVERRHPRLGKTDLDYSLRLLTVHRALAWILRLAGIWVVPLGTAVSTRRSGFLDSQVRYAL